MIRKLKSYEVSHVEHKGIGLADDLILGQVHDEVDLQPG